VTRTIKTKTLIKYEKEFAELVGTKYARATCLGRQALAVLLKAAGIQTGDKVGICSFTCLSVIEAVKVCGGVPIFLDTDESLCINPDEIIRHGPNQLKVVVLQHTFGNPGKFDRLLKACEENGAIVIEDCAHALGCYWDGKPLGSFGVGSIYSFQWGKPVTTGQGGMLTVNSDVFRDRVDSIIRPYAVPQSVKSSFILQGERMAFNMLHPHDYDLKLRHLCKKIKCFLPQHDYALPERWDFEKGYVVLPGEAMARAGLKNLKKWPQTLKEKKEAMALIADTIALKAFCKVWVSPQAEVIFQRYPFIINNKDDIILDSIRNNLDISGWYNTPVHPLKGEQLRAMGYTMGSCPNTELLFKTLVHVPINVNFVKAFDKYLSVLAKMR
jgi:perosamine synthetase